MVRAFQKRQRDAQSQDLQGEREQAKRRILELEAETKLLKSFSDTQADEVAQSHGAELATLQRRVGDLEEEKACAKRTYEQRLAEETALRIAEVQDVRRTHAKTECDVTWGTLNISSRS